jgi:HEPN domain-containing protein
MAQGPSMTSLRLAKAFLDRARSRLESLDALRDEADLSDVVREARDIVDLCFRSMLRVRDIEMPRWRDVGEVLKETIGKFPADVRVHEERLLGIYDGLNGSRHQAGPPQPARATSDRSMIPEADQAAADAEWVLSIAQMTMDILGHHRTPVTQAR